MRSSILIILMFVSTLTFGQVVKTNMGYLLSKEDLSIIDFYARKGVQCDTIIPIMEAHLAENEEVKNYSDSVVIALDRKIFAITNKFQEVQTANQICARTNRDLTIELNVANKANKKLRTKNTIGTIVSTIVSAVAVYAFIK